MAWSFAFCTSAHIATGADTPRHEESDTYAKLRSTRARTPARRDGFAFPSQVAAAAGDTGENVVRKFHTTDSAALFDDKQAGYRRAA